MVSNRLRAVESLATSTTLDPIRGHGGRVLNLVVEIPKLLAHVVTLREVLGEHERQAPLSASGDHRRYGDGPGARGGGNFAVQPSVLREVGPD